MRKAILYLWASHVLIWHLSLCLDSQTPTLYKRIQGALQPHSQTKHKTAHTLGEILRSEGQLRKLQQLARRSSGDFDCRLTRQEMERILDVDARIWRIDDTVWVDIREDLQEIVNCSEERDTLLFNVSKTLQPSRQIAFPWSLTLSSAVNDTDLVDGVFPETRRKTAFRCPSSNSGLFLVQSPNALFANLVFKDCSLNGAGSAAVIEVSACDGEDVQGSIQLHHVEFRQNRLNGTMGLFVNEASCSTLEMVHVRFKNNTCSGFCGAVLGSQNTLRHLRVRQNVQLGVSSIPAILYAPPKSQTTLQDLKAMDNHGPIVYAHRGELKITNASFQRNTAGDYEESAAYGGGVYVEDSTTILRHCRFEDSTTPSGSGVFAVRSNVTLRDSSFEQNEGIVGGGAVYLDHCREVDVQDCTFAKNFVSGQNGAGMLSNVTETLSVRNSVFLSNSAGNGAAIYVVGGDVNIVDAHFESNMANVSGGAVLLDNAALTLKSTVFRNNTAQNHGGAAFVRRSSQVAIRHLTCRECSAISGGCMHLLQTSFTLNDSLIQGNSALDSGGGIMSENSNAGFYNVTWKSNNATALYGGGSLVDGGVATYEDAVFERNNAQSGGGVGVDGSHATFIRVRFLNNTAVSHGGGFFSNNGTIHIEDAFFANNSADFGGAMRVDWNSRANVTRTRVAENVAKTNGGGVMLIKGRDVRLSDSVFERNRASQFGGCVAVEEMSAVLSNVTMEECLTDRTGAGIAALPGSRVNVTSSNFRKGRAVRAAGAIFALTASLNVIDSFIFACTANTSGGAMYLEQGTEANIQSSNISNNFATSDGGGIYLTRSRLFGENFTLHKNTADAGGGGVGSVDITAFWLKNVSFIQNRSPYGAGALLFGDGNGTLVECFAYNNSATGSGGAVYTEESNLTVHGGRYVENKAGFGGNFALFDGRLELENISVINGSATYQGGGVFAISDSIITATRSDFLSNRAENGGAVYLERAYFWGQEARFAKCKAKEHGGAINANISSSVLCTGCVFEDNVVGGRGGAVNIDSQTTQLLAYQFDNCTYSNNRGVLGGGLHFVSQDRTEDCAVHDARCSFVALQGTRFFGNQASSAGGAILSSDLNAVRIDCSNKTRQDPLQYLTRPAFELMDTLNDTNRVCHDWTDNKADGYGNSAASYAFRIRKKIIYEDRNEEEVIPGNRYIVRNHVSGSQIPRLSLESVDALGQGPAPGTDNKTIVATMSSPDGLFSGSLNVEMDNGMGSFSGVAGYRESGFYDVRVEFSERSFPSLTIVIEIRSCVIGEALAANGTLCQPCIGNTYNFFPERSDMGCLPCPENSNCGAVFITPDDGYWHQTPCSDHIQECLTKHACSEKNRKENIRELYDSVQGCQFTESFIRNYADSECRKGYKGPLCGSCESSYGRSRSFRCEPCRTGFGSFVLAVLSIIMLLVLSAFAIRSSVSTRIASPAAAQGQQCSAASSTSGDARQGPRATLPTVHMQMVEMLPRGHGPAEFVGFTHLQQQQKHSAPSSLHSVAQRWPTDEDALIARWKAVEIFKMTINYLQVIAVAISINVDWTEALVAVFETAEFLGGLTSEAATRSVDCLVSEDSAIPRSAVRTVVSIIVPMLVTGLYFVLWAFALVRANETLSYLAKRCILSFMAVSYLSYIAITKTAVNVLSCVSVHDSLLVGSDATMKYWQVDTSLRCYKGTHAMLAGLVGWPVLIIFSIGFPAAVALLLIVERRRHDMESEWLFEATGFMYRAYQKKYVYWESVIMLRKAVLAVVVVFSYALGANLQGILGVCVLMLALYFQMVCQPFRSEFAELNEYEGLSLLVCALTFVSGLCFNDERTTGGFRIFFTGSLISVNLGLVFFFATAFLKAGAVYLRTVLEAENIDYDVSKGPLYVVRVYLHSRMPSLNNCIFFRLLKRSETDNADGSTHANSNV